MVTRKDCIDEIAARAGRKRQEVEDELDDMFERAKSFQETGLPLDMAYAKARDQRLLEEADRKARARRAQIMDLRKEASRHRYYGDTESQIKEKAPKYLGQAPRLAMEAKLVGVNLPFFKNRQSVDAQYVALRRLWVGGFAKDLEDKNLLKIFASRQIQDNWTDELFELNKGNDGNPGVTTDAQALEIAKTIQKWQRQSMDALNREGAWVRSYSGYITRTSHDPYKIGKAGPEKWVADTLPKLNLPKTFGTMDKARVVEALTKMWEPMRTGDHFDYGKPLDEPIFPNVAAKASAERELHFKSGADWRAYNAQYGVSDATKTVVDALARGARRVALMKEFGTKPAEAFEGDMNYIKARLQSEASERLGKLATLSEEPETNAEAISALNKEIEANQGKFPDFQNWEQKLRNRFAQIDGSSQRPVNSLSANLAANVMAVQRMSKLGRVALTHFASLPTKAAEARYWGIPFAERYSSLFRGLTQGMEGSAKREALDATLVAFENRLGHMMSTYDVADAPAGVLAHWESLFFRMTGVSSVVDNQRGDAEAMFAAHVGGKRGQAWAEIGPKEQRVLRGFGIGETEWKALHGVEWSKFGDRTYLTPADAMKLSDEQVAAYIADTDPLRARLAGLPPRIPPVPKGSVRFFHGGAPEGGEPPTTGGGRWATPHFEYARDYRATEGKPGQVWYVDVPKGEFLTRPELASGFDEINDVYRHVELPEDIAKQMQSYRPGARSSGISASDLAQARENLALQLATAYSDRAGYAIPMPSARIRASLFQKNFEPGTPINTALKLLLQFKIWPADMIVRAWGRDVYGTIGDGRLDRLAGLTETLVAMTIFGVASEAVREAIQGKDPLDKLVKHPFAAIAEGMQRSGVGSLFGDYLLGQYDRHGFSAVASAAGPTFGQIDTLMDLLHAGGETKEGMWSPAANRQREADLIKLARDNLPFQNLWFNSLALNTLVWHRLQEWINPGYLQRSERRQADQNGTKFWISPAKTDRWVTGRAASPF